MSKKKLAPRTHAIYVKDIVRPARGGDKAIVTDVIRNIWGPEGVDRVKVRPLRKSSRWFATGFHASDSLVVVKRRKP